MPKINARFGALLIDFGGVQNGGEAAGEHIDILCARTAHQLGRNRAWTTKQAFVPIFREFCRGEEENIFRVRAQREAGITFEDDLMEDPFFKNWPGQQPLGVIVSGIRTFMDNGLRVVTVTTVSPPLSRIMERDGRYAHCHGVIRTCDPEIRALKPDRKVYQTAADLAGFALKQCLVVDDDLENVSGAIDLGAGGLHITNPEPFNVLDRISGALLGMPQRQQKR